MTPKFSNDALIVRLSDGALRRVKAFHSDNDTYTLETIVGGTFIINSAYVDYYYTLKNDPINSLMDLV